MRALGGLARISRNLGRWSLVQHELRKATENEVQDKSNCREAGVHACEQAQGSRGKRAQGACVHREAKEMG